MQKFYATFLCNNFSGAFLANASNPDCIEGFGAKNVCNGKKECIGMRDELDCGKPNCMMVCNSASVRDPRIVTLEIRPWVPDK